MFIWSALYSVHLLATEPVPTIAVIVGAEVQVEKLKLNANSLKLIYLRKQLYWPNGQRILPVNQDAATTLRQQFSQAVLGSLPKQQVDYWNGLYFNGIQPPHSVSSDESVMRYVSETKGSIGYIDACHLDARVQPVLWVIDGVLTATNRETFNCKPPYSN